MCIRDRSPSYRVSSKSQTVSDDVILDLQRFDFTLWMKVAGLLSMLSAAIGPVIYVHAILPAQFTFAAIPCYLAMGVFASSYWRVLPQLQRSGTRQWTMLCDHISEIMEGGAERRAFRETGVLTNAEIEIIGNFANSRRLVRKS